MNNIKYIKRTIAVEAIQYTYPASDELRAFCPVLGIERKSRHPNAVGEIEIRTLEDVDKLKAEHIVTEKDYIIKGVKGEFYPCKPDIFAATYKKAFDHE